MSLVRHGNLEALLAIYGGLPMRGRAFAIFMAAPLLGPGIGPILGAYISSAISWRWVFWIPSIVSAAVFILALLFLQETYEPRLAYLEQVARQSSQQMQEETTTATFNFSPLWTNLQRPIRMLGTQLIIQLIAIYMALLYGTMFLFLYMYSTLWVTQYGQSARMASLNYLSAAIGFIVGVQGKTGYYDSQLLDANNITTQWLGT
jgi:MFS family permease